MSRPRPLAALAAAVAGTALLLTGCSTGSTAEDKSESKSVTKADEGAFPVTIEHSLGKTTIEKEPKRVVALGYTDPDVALSLGVVPVGASKVVWGGNEEGSTDWFDEALEKADGEQPERLDDADGAPIEEIAALEPDLVLATNSGLTKQEYTKLSEFVPVVAYPGDPWLTPWQDSVEMVGKALGRSEKAAEVTKESEQLIKDKAAEYPELKNKTFVWGSLYTTDMSKVDYYTPADNRPKLLTELGMKNAPAIEKIAKPGEFFGTVSAEKAAELDSDVFIFYGEAKGDLATFQKNPLIGQIPALKDGRVFASGDKMPGLGFSVPTPLSLPDSLDYYLPNIVKALGGTPVEDAPAAGGQ